MVESSRHGIDVMCANPFDILQNIMFDAGRHYVRSQQNRHWCVCVCDRAQCAISHAQCESEKEMLARDNENIIYLPETILSVYNLWLLHVYICGVCDRMKFSVYTSRVRASACLANNNHSTANKLNDGGDGVTAHARTAENALSSETVPAVQRDQNNNTKCPVPCIAHRAAQCSAPYDSFIVDRLIADVRPGPSTLIVVCRAAETTAIQCIYTVSFNYQPYTNILIIQSFATIENKKLLTHDVISAFQFNSNDYVFNRFDRFEHVHVMHHQR